MPTIMIDNQELQVEPGTTIIEAADSIGVYIPRFCYHEKLSVAANCRMCLVEVERAPKSLPACATPIMDGMKVFTHSAAAVQAQKDTLEFLLINHPLDCPICDQGGECPLQDQALGYGGGTSRFSEKKRVVHDHNIGPLIETEMTRCIHCTRCVRFGEEIAGVMELGITGRGEHLKIDTFFEREVQSEVSGNVIDLCPVGALTSKPYRFTARSWELINHEAISPHDCVGTNINVQTLRGEVKRVLPRDNESINECWIADRDRYSYEAMASTSRLTRPMIRTAAGMVECEWQIALNRVAEGLRGVIESHGEGALGALVAPTATLEEFYLVQKLIRSLGGMNVDHRLRQLDFSMDEYAPLHPGTGVPIETFSSLDNVLLVGSNIRKEQPLLGLKIRKAWRSGATVSSINSLAYQHNFGISSNVVVPPSEIPGTLVRVLLHVCRNKDIAFPEDLNTLINEFNGAERDEAQLAAIAESLCTGDDGASLIILGLGAINHRNYNLIDQLANRIANLCGIQVATLPPANSAAAWVAGCVPHRVPNGVAASVTGLNAAQMIDEKLAAYLLFDMEPHHDLAHSYNAVEAMESAEFVVGLQAFDHVPDYMDVVLPIAPFTENTGTFVNCEGRIQKSTAATSPLGETRPGWKVLRVLGNFLNLSGFDYVNVDDVVQEVSPKTGFDGDAMVVSDARIAVNGEQDDADSSKLEVVCEQTIYGVDTIVRRAPALQSTADAVASLVHLNPVSMQNLDLEDHERIVITWDSHSIESNAVADDRVPLQCAYLPNGVAALLTGDGSVTIRSLEDRDA